MSADLEKRLERSTDAFPNEVTANTQAAINVVQMAVSLGFIDRLISVLSGRCGRLIGDAFDSPRPGERRNEQWRGREKGTVSLDLTSTDGSGESDSLDRMGDNLWSLFRRKTKLRKR